MVRIGKTTQIAVEGLATKAKAGAIGGRYEFGSDGED